MREGSTRSDPRQELDPPSQSAQSTLDLVSAEATLNNLAELFGPHRPPNQDFLPARSESSPPFSEALKYRLLVDRLPAVVFMASLEGGIGDAYVSPQIEAMLGFSQSEWLQDPIRWYQHIHPDDKERWSVEAAQMFLSGTPLKSVYRVLSRAGRVVWFQCEASMLRRDDGRPWAIQGVGFDITSLKESEQTLYEKNEELKLLKAEADAANRAKTIFLQTVSHEIRTPMNAILGYAQLMSQDPDLGTTAKANLKIISQSGEHLVALITDVLDMSKIEAGRTEINTARFNFRQLVDYLVSMFRLSAEAKALRLEVLFDGEAVEHVVADEGKVRQILINLLGNAIKFTASGLIKLHVTLCRRRANQLWLSATIEDTGPGIADEEQGRLFQPFSQMRRGLKVQEGTGLGLAIARSYARLMGGDITVTSIFGRGSTFQFDIPIESDDLQIDSAPSSQTDATRLRTETAASSPGVKPLKLLALPVELINELHHAVQNGEKDRLDELIRNAGDFDRRAGAALKQLADDYEYDALTCLLEESKRGLLP
jgi:PAS domain S-box-containing protein